MDVPEAVPDRLLVPLLEVAADTLRSMDAPDVPLSLRHLHGFDRRGLLHGPGPRQLRRGLAEDDSFAAAVRDAFAARPGVAESLAAWAPADAAEIVTEADGRGDLPLLASVLVACAPSGAAFGLGLVVAADLAGHRDRGDARQRREHERARAEAEEARQRAEAARMRAEADATRATDEVRALRSARREREERAEAAADAARREAADFAAQLAEERAAREAGDARAARASDRVRALEGELQRLRADLARAREDRDDTPTRLHARDAAALVDAVGAAQRLAARLDEIRRRVQVGPAVTAGAEDAARPEGGDRPPVRRARPRVPAGVVAESVAGIESMLRSDDVLLVVDGYNVTKRAWGDATAADQRERLTRALAAASGRYGCEVVCVFDGDGSGPIAVARRGGVDVVFSDAGVEADEVVVRIVATKPRSVPIVVASSDGWVRDHAAAEGAVVVPADALLAVLQRR